MVRSVFFLFFLMAGCAEDFASTSIRQQTPMPPPMLETEEARRWTYEQGYKRGLWEATQGYGYRADRPEDMPCAEVKHETCIKDAGNGQIICGQKLR